MVDEGTPIDGVAASTTDLVSALPNVHDWLSSLLGINLPHLPPLPQTIKNLDKALGRIVLATGENLSSRLEGNTNIRKEKSIALGAAVKASSKGFVGELKSGGNQYERAIEYTFGSNILSQSNREKVAKMACEDIASKSDCKSPDASNEISDDWLNTFSDFVGRKSNEDVQALWSKILAGEIRKPGSFKLKSLISMAAVDSADALTLNELLSKAINGDFIFKADSNEDLGPYIGAESLDVLTVAGGMLTKSFQMQENSLTYFRIGPVLLLAKSLHAMTLQVPQYKLTQFGRDLYSISSYTTEDEEYINAFIGHLKNAGMVVQRAKVIGTSDAGIHHTPFIDC